MSTITAPPQQLAQLKLGALYEVNQIRLGLGAEPLAELPQGRIGCAQHCVIANAFADLGEVLVIPQRTIILTFEREKRHLFRHSVMLTTFIYLFDRGAFPELGRFPRADAMSALR